MEISDDVVEAAARVMLSFERPNHPWDEWSKWGHDTWKSKARAVLEVAGLWADLAQQDRDAAREAMEADLNKHFPLIEEQFR